MKGSLWGGHKMALDLERWTICVNRRSFHGSAMFLIRFELGKC
jgi:hypothetical protein